MEEQRNAVADGIMGMLNVFVDPGATAKRIPSPWFWVWPVIVTSIGYIVFGYLMLPYTLQVIDLGMAERNMPPDQLERAKSMAHMITQYTVPATPVFVVGFTALFAALIMVMCSMMDVKTRFRDMFSLLAVCSLIPFLQYIATYVVLKSRGDTIQSKEEMTPPFGLDIFLHDAHGALFSILNFFSIFQVWYLIILVLTFAAFTRASKTKAIVAITPVWLILLLFRIIANR